MRNKTDIVETFCEIASVVATNLRKVKTFNENSMCNEHIDEFLICDCFCERNIREWKKGNRIDDLVVDFIRKAVEDKILELDIDHDLKELNLSKFRD